MSDLNDAPAEAPKSFEAYLQAWVEPDVAELALSRTANNPSAGSDGGTGDCQHL
jgi:hypothetical protein